MSDNKQPAAKPGKPAHPAQIECAVLHDCVYGKHDDIIVLDRAVAEAAAQSGYVDTHPNAIKAIRG